MRIAITGAHSTGKTTLIDRFSELYPAKRLHVIRGVARGVIARGFLMGKASTVDGWINYIGDQLRAERQSNLASFDLLFSDRTVLDALGYALANRNMLKQEIPGYFVDMLLEIALRQTQFYDLYAFIPIEFPMTPDGVRDEDEAYRSRVSDEIHGVLAAHNINYVKLKGSVDGRSAALWAAVDAHRIGAGPSL
jgi:nicotinamide riboside kinase